MISSFFITSGRTTRAIAWAGLVIVVAYSAFVAYVKARINDFYATFYDLLGALPTVVESEFGSGPTPLAVVNSSISSSSDVWTARQWEVWEQLLLFGEIIGPLVFAAPIAKWVRSAWAFRWRSCLMKTYLDVWDVTSDPIEGASQRLHEDTQRFCSALQGCLATVLDALFTLAVFAPILITLSGQVQAPGPLVIIQPFWLLATAFLAAFIGLGGAVLVGQKLVMLEVANQRVEANLRRDLVILESSPASICGTFTASSGSGGFRDSSGRTAAGGTSPIIYFSLTFKRLMENYHALFRHFTVLNLWLTLFDQVMVIFPYALVAPLIFSPDPEHRITLGTMIKVTNSFDKVFSSLSVISENWAAVNDFRSVAIRLREFEKNLYNGQPPVTSTRLGEGNGVVVVAGEPMHPSRSSNTNPAHIEMHLTSTYGHELEDMRI